ncbi:hypothetical protein Droror1_Dr00007101 [Drosera rotundifolia]
MKNLNWSMYKMIILLKRAPLIKQKANSFINKMITESRIEYTYTSPEGKSKSNCLITPNTIPEIIAKTPPSSSASTLHLINPDDWPKWPIKPNPNQPTITRTR